MKPNDAFHSITTLVRATTSQIQTQGTAFFYQELAPKTKEGPQWRQVKETWLVTNRHVVLPKINNREVIPDEFYFHLRKIENDRLIWEPITLRKDELIERALFHKDDSIDVCVIKVLDLIINRIQTNPSKYMSWYAVDKEKLPGNNNIFVEVGDDVLVIGYPRGYYDDVHLYPIVKSGIIASRWGAPFRGKPYFLIDIKLFPGSSGSIVVSKPQQLAIIDEKLMYAKEKQFAFLGIYSGKPFLMEEPIELEDIVIIRKKGFDLGVVWYSYLIDEIINEGVRIR